ncbi:MAG: PIN domain-containing protein [Verrucomicrobia bacterium]|nr:PIN domain-containing protein [Verrucomicrobiota bacterium]
MDADLLNDRCYVDTNVFIYLFDTASGQKRETAAMIYRALLQSKRGCTSLLVVSEWRNVMIRKYATVMPTQSRRAFLRLLGVWNPATITLTTIQNAEALTAKYCLSPFDSLHVQSDLDQSCKYFLSEDMQDGLVVDNRLEIVNPFQ